MHLNLVTWYSEEEEESPVQWYNEHGEEGKVVK